MKIIIEVILLFISSSALAVLVLQIFGYLRKIYQLRNIKQMISLGNSSDTELLDYKNVSQKRSFLSKLNSKKMLLGIENISNVVLFFVEIVFLSLCILVFSIFLKNIYIGVVLGLLVGSGISYWIIELIISYKTIQFNRALAIVISVLVKMMKNGVGFEQSLQKAVDISSSVMLKNVFSRFFHEKNTIGEEEAFDNMNKYIKSRELRIFALSVKIGRASGGRFSQTLHKVELTIRHRKKMQEKIDVVTRESSVGSYLIAGIAVFLYFALNANFQGKIQHFYMTSHYGRFELLGIIAWVIFGLFINRIITRIEK